MKRVSFPFAVYFLCSCMAYAASLGEFTDQAMIKIKASSFDKLFDDYVVPIEYTEQNVQSDKEGIITGFKYLEDALGSLEDFTKIDSVPEPLIPIQLGTGSPETTGSLPSTDVFYKAAFSKLPSAYIGIAVYEQDTNLFIKNITIGLPQSNPRSMETAKGLAKFMSDFASKQEKKDSTTPMVVNDQLGPSE